MIHLVLTFLCTSNVKANKTVKSSFLTISNGFRVFHQLIGLWRHNVFLVQIPML